MSASCVKYSQFVDLESATVLFSMFMFIYKYIYEQWPNSFDVDLNFSLLFVIADPFLWVVWNDLFSRIKFTASNIGVGESSDILKAHPRESPSMRQERKRIYCNSYLWRFNQINLSVWDKITTLDRLILSYF